MSYIDREALIERLCYVCGADCDKNICTVKQTVEYMPSADVEPVRHGMWVTEKYPLIRCSRCDAVMIITDYDNYCPNCGAKMDEVSE